MSKKNISGCVQFEVGRRKVVDVFVCGEEGGKDMREFTLKNPLLQEAKPMTNVWKHKLYVPLFRAVDVPRP